MTYGQRIKAVSWIFANNPLDSNFAVLAERQFGDKIDAAKVIAVGAGVWGKAGGPLLVAGLPHGF